MKGFSIFGLRFAIAGSGAARASRASNRKSRIENRESRAIILPVVLVIVGLLALIMAGFVFFVRAEVSGMTAFNDGQQVRLAAESALEEAVSILRVDRDNPKLWYDNPDRFRHALVWSDIYTRQTDPIREAGSRQKYFESNPDRRVAYRHSLVAARYDGPAGIIRYGITPEGGKLNLNVSTEKQLTDMLTPLLTEMGVQNPQDIINAIIDWRDGDDDMREGGAENEYYHTLKPAYNCKNGPFDTIEELLLVKGVTPAILYGEDVNRNGILDTNENDGDASFPDYDNGDGVLNQGIAAFLTVHARDFDRSIDNKQKLNLNADATAIQALAVKTLAEGELSEASLQFILGLKQQNFNFSTMRSPAELYAPVGMAVTAEEQQKLEEQQLQQQQSGDKTGGGSQQQGGGQGQPQQQNGGAKQDGQSRVKSGTMQEKQPAGGGGQPAPPPPSGGQGGGRGGRGGQGGGRQPGGQPAGGQPPGGQQDGVQSGGQQDQNGQPGGGQGRGGGGRGGRGGGGQQRQISVAEAVANSPITADELPVIMDRFSVRPVQQANAPLTGLININTAPGRVLMTIPGITEEAASAILTTREKLDGAALKTTAWPLVYAGVEPAVYKAIAPFITVRAYQFHVEALGYADHVKIARRVEWIIEMVGPLAQIKYTRDLTALGFAWPIDDDSVVTQSQ